jgi:hypothetical protein
MSGTASRSRGRTGLHDFLACFLILVAHFANYLTYVGYARVFPDIMVVAALLVALAAVLALAMQLPSRVPRVAIFSILISIVIGDAAFEFGVADISTRLIAISVTIVAVVVVVTFIGRHTSKVLIGTFLTVLLSTFAIAAFEGLTNLRTITAYTSTVAAGNNNLPVVVHLILDEHTGPAGMTPDLLGADAARTALTTFYLDNGFRLYDRAYSQFDHTALSLSTALNLDPTGMDTQYLTPRRYGYKLDKNRYLDQLAADGYRIKIYQSDFFDFCHAGTSGVESCLEYRPNAVDAGAVGALALGGRVRLLVNMYYSSIAVVKLATLGQNSFNRWLARNDIPLPELSLWHGRAGPAAVAPVIDRMESDLARGTRGTVYFAHLLTPHYPYVFGPDCEIRPTSSWLLRHRNDSTNTPASRQTRYSAYFDQTRCVLKDVDRLINTMKHAGTFDDATFVVHGDHGARINLHDPRAEAVNTLDNAAFADAFSTLFAVRRPGIEPGTDQRMSPLPTLIRHVLTGEPLEQATVGTPPVFLKSESGTYEPSPIQELRQFTD